jgi:agmatine deiminase
MITDKETDLVYFSELLKINPKYSANSSRITRLLDQFNIEYRFLANTKDIWARDYMPVQVADDRFIEYQYNPDYLKEDKWNGIRTITSEVCNSIKLTTIKTNIILDGGNVIKSADCVIMTQKIFSENTGNYQSDELTEKLKSLFGVSKIAFIPKDEPMFGHSDGMARFIDEETVLLNGYFKERGEQFKKILFSSLEQCGLKWKFLKYNVPNPDKRNWAYINFLQMKDILMIPKFNILEDQQAFEQFCEYYPSYTLNNRIHQVDLTEIIKDGGALNCISWNIKSV